MWIAATALIVIIGGGAGAMVALNGEKSANQISSVSNATFVVQKGHLTISVTESGTIAARDQVELKNEVEGETTILSIIEEGAQVKKGDLLIELDSSRLVDMQIDQQITVNNAEALFIQARENLAVVKNQAEADKAQATLDYRLAQLNLTKYEQGEYPQLLQQAEAEITLANEEFQRASQNLEWTQQLNSEGYVSDLELQRDQLAKKRYDLEKQLAEGRLALLKEFTHTQTVEELQSAVEQARLALERVTLKAKADVVQAEAELSAKESEFNRQSDKLQKLKEQIAKTKLYAPSSGLVVHATSVTTSRRSRGSQEPLAEGQRVYERQPLIYLPTSNSVMAVVKVHESSMDKVREGSVARVTVDALPGRQFTGKVARIAPLPDQQSIWMNPDLKVYSTEIYIDGDGSDLRTGMSCQAEVLVEEYEDVVYVPIQSVIRLGRTPTVYVVSEQGLEARPVEIGLDNNRMVHVISGLEPGERVLMSPPLDKAAADDDAKAKKAKGRAAPTEGGYDDQLDQAPKPKKKKKQPSGPDDSGG